MGLHPPGVFKHVPTLGSFRPPDPIFVLPWHVCALVAKWFASYVWTTVSCVVCSRPSVKCHRWKKRPRPFQNRAPTTVSWRNVTRKKDIQGKAVEYIQLSSWEVIGKQTGAVGHPFSGHKLANHGRGVSKVELSSTHSQSNATMYEMSKAQDVHNPESIRKGTWLLEGTGSAGV
jgi:hypothetical protein